VQGQLEHPSVVPVYDLGLESSGRSFFTMKRVRGRTLREVLSGLRARDATLEAEFSLRRMLSAFSQLCWAVAFAHSRGVVHRDIKPENVMFGDFGEVHLLDWGVATVIEDLRATSEEGARGVVDAELPNDHRTLAGEMIGTPGYMSPEQINGNPDELDERVDVVALGAVLFEILTLEPLIEGVKTHEVVAATLTSVDARARARAPERDVPPELELVCVRATAPLETRTAGARELREAVERYLDGDRDIERRRELAAQRVAAAEAKLATKSGLPLTDDSRTTALRELGAAVALDPTGREARELLTKLLLQGPEQMPEEARRELEENRQARRTSMRRTIFFVSLVFLTAPLSLLAMGVRNWTWFAILGVANALVPVMAFYSHKRRDDRLSPQLLAASAMLALSAGSFVLGPLMQATASILAVTIVFLSLSAPGVRTLAIPLAVVALLAPVALELLGAVPKSHVFVDGAMQIMPTVVWLHEGAVLSFLTFVGVTPVLLSGFVVLRRQRLLDRLEERLFLQAWTLGRLFPSEAGVSMQPDSQRPPRAA
jgi:hypothetical protein